jgi:hypothetical protein
MESANTWRTRACWAGRLTKTRSEELRVEIREELLALCIELAHSRNDVAGQTDADNFHDGFEDEESEVGEVGMRAVRRLLLEDLEEAIVAVVVRMRSHGDKGVVGAGLHVAQAQGLGGGEEGHVATGNGQWAMAKPRGWARALCWEGAEGKEVSGL